MRRAPLLSLWMASWLPLVWGQQRPLVSEPVETVPAGYVRAELGLEFLQGARFPLSGLEGDLTRIGVFALRFGAGERVEIQITGSLQDFLNVDQRFAAPHSSRLDFAGNSTSDFGDTTLATKLRLLREKERSPGLGFRFAVELPNASNESGLGKDETNAFVQLLVEKKIRQVRLLGNAGLAILGDPVSAASQDDLLTYGLALTYELPSGLALVADFYGRTGRGGIGTEDQTRLRLGSRIWGGGLWWDVAALLGFSSADPETGLIFGVSRDIRLGF